MTTSSNDSLILKLTVAKNLIDQELAKEVFRQSQEEGRPAVEILQERGILTQHIAQSLQKEAERVQGPKIIGGFRVVSKIGQGGMGSVYKAVQVSMEREVALKVIAPEFAKDKEACERFIREGRAAGRINHPNVITCYDVGQDGRILYMAMELVLGGDADKAAKAAGGRLPVQRALEIVRDAARGLSAIHAAGLIHRDIKPANIFLTQSGEAKLADLGLARSQQGDDRMTVSGATVGTPAFMSPEQADGAPDVDIRGDIYALGATLYALICGQAPFRGSSPWAVVASVLKDPFPDPRKLGCSDAVSAIIERACAKDRTQRYQDPGQLLADLDRALAGGPVATAPPAPPAVPPRVRPVTPRPAPLATPLWRSQSFLATAIGVLILVGAMAWWTVPSRGKASDLPAAVPTQPPATSRPAVVGQTPAPPSSSRDQGYGWRKESDMTTDPSPPVVNTPVTPEPIPADTSVAKSLTAEERALLARFAGRWETVTEPIKDQNGWAIHRDPRNQALLIHPDQMDVCRYTRITLTPPWNGYRSPIVTVTPDRIDIRHMDHDNVCSYVLRDQTTLVRTLTEDYAEEAGKILLLKGTDIILKRQAAGKPRSEWEPQLWRALDGLWETQLEGQKKGIFLIDAQRQLIVGSDGYVAPLFVDPLRALLVRDIYHTLHHDPVHDALIWMEGWTPVISQRSSGQGWIPFPEKTILARPGPLPASPPLDETLARRLEGTWRNKSNTAEMRISTKDGTVTFPAPGALFVDKGVPEIIPRVIRSVGGKGDFDLLRTTMPFRVDGQRLLLNCRPDFTIGTARIEVGRWFYGKPESLERVAP